MDPMRLILIAIGGYLVYRATYGSATAVGGESTTTGGTTTGTGGTTTGGTTTTGTTGGSTGTATGGNTNTGTNASAYYTALWNEDPTQVSTLSAPFDNGKDFVLAKGATGDAAAIAVLNDHGVQLGPDQWNVYHVLGGAPVIDPNVMDMYIAGDRAPIGVNEYRTRIAAAGLSGLSGLGCGACWGGDWA